MYKPPGSNYSSCDHERSKRLDKNFVRCIQCGQSFISQETPHQNKRMGNFVNDNNSFQRNFNRNFNNIIPEIESYAPAPTEYYIDMKWIYYVIIDRTPIYESNPTKYKIEYGNINSSDKNTNTLTDTQINELLHKIKAIKIPKEQYDSIKNKITP